MRKPSASDTSSELSSGADRKLSLDAPDLYIVQGRAQAALEGSFKSSSRASSASLPFPKKATTRVSFVDAGGYVRESIVSVPCAIRAPAPTILAVGRYQLFPTVVPVLLLLAVQVVITAVAPIPRSQMGYLVLYIAAFILVVLWLFGALVMKTQRLVLQLGDLAPDVLQSSPEQAASLLSSDPLIRYVQARVFNTREHAVEPEQDQPEADPLQFVQKELEVRASDTNGHVMIDTTGIVLWCNGVLLDYFKFEEEELVGQNVRLLMPPPYNTQHDALLRQYDRANRKKIVGHTRRVPVVDKNGQQSSILLGVEEMTDPDDDTNSVFLGKMTFGAQTNEPDPVITLQTNLDSGIADIAQCCAELDASSQTIVVIDSKGIIQYSNDAAMVMLGYGYAELVGRNVTCLMMDEHASQHDAILARYQQKLDSAAKNGLPAPDSKVVGQGRDFYCKTKSGELIRIFLTVKRVDRPSRQTSDCLFVGHLLFVQDAKQRFGAVSAGFTSKSRVDKLVKLSPFKLKKCTVMAVSVCGLTKGHIDDMHRDYQTLLNLLTNLCRTHKAALQSPVGDGIFVTLNLHIPNAAHRGSAGGLLFEFMKLWKNVRHSGGPKVYAAASSRECYIGSWDGANALLTDAYDMCSALLRAGVEANTSSGMIDAALEAELQYSFECRPINVLTVVAGNYASGSSSGCVYELQAAKEIPDDEWMYQILQQSSEDPLLTWKAAWDALGGEKAAAGLVQPDYTAALEQLALCQDPDDRSAAWLQDAVKQKVACVPYVPPRKEVAGALKYVLHYQVDPGTSALASPTAP